MEWVIHFEGSGIARLFHIVELAAGLLESFVGGVQVEGLKMTTGKKETSCIRSRVVGKTNLNINWAKWNEGFWNLKLKSNYFETYVTVNTI